MSNRGQAGVSFSCLAFVLFFALSLVGCQETPSQSIRVGLAGVQTGSYGAFGEKMFAGSRLAIEEWNARGGVLGKQIEIISRDDEGKPEKAVSVAQEMAGQGVVAVIGHVNSGCTLPAAPIYARAGILQVTPSSSPEITEQGVATLFRIYPRDDQQGAIAARFLRKNLGLSRVAVLHDKTTYGEGIAREFKSTFESLGGQVASYAGMGGSELDFRADLAAIKESGAQGLFWGGAYSQGGPLFSQMRQAGMDLPFMTGDGCYEKAFINTVGDDAKKAYLTFGEDYKTWPSAHPFLKKYRAQFGEEGSFSIHGYDAANLILMAIEEAGTTEASKVAEVLRRKTFDLALGATSFDSKGDLKDPKIIVWTIQDGAFTPVP